MSSKGSIRIYADDTRKDRYKRTASSEGLTVSDWGRRELDAAVERSARKEAVEESV